MISKEGAENGAREGRIAHGAIALALTLGAILRGWQAFTDDGIYWPDEIYQSLEPAHWLVHGYGLLPWELVEGARNWTLPGIVAALLKGSSLVGWEHPRKYLLLVRLFFAATSLATSVGAYFLARILGAGRLPAAAGMVFSALCAPALYFAPRALGETMSALPVVFGVALGWRRRGARDLALGASLLGFAVLLRLQNGIFCLGLLGILAARRDSRGLAQASLVLMAWAVAYGVIDKLTWGGWFHSAFVYLRFNLIDGKSAAWGGEPFTYYFHALGTSLGPITAALAGLFSLIGALRARGVAAVVALFLLAHSLTPHKELRFVMPALPLLCALAAVGIEQLVRVAGSHRPLVRVSLASTLVLLAVGSLANYRTLTFGALGQHKMVKPLTRAFDHYGPVNRLLLIAHEKPDLCGIKIEMSYLAWTGGHSYLHRRVPIYSNRGPSAKSKHWNYLIASDKREQIGEVVARDRDRVLVRSGHEACVPDPGYRWRLE
ncbi:MAG: hypothetical protein HY698_21330 [Deltaproteobacteria bacterium]|nr:hypothetical protein [Deltaproteobacteria bacterium]